MNTVDTDMIEELVIRVNREALKTPEDNNDIGKPPIAVQSPISSNINK